MNYEWDSVKDRPQTAKVSFLESNYEWDSVKDRPQTAKVSFLESKLQKLSFLESILKPD